MEKFIPHNQAVFRKGRSMKDVVSNHKMKIASTITSSKRLEIQGIDLTSVFNRVDREKLMKVIDNVCTLEDSKLVNFFLKNTKLRVRTNEEGLTFVTNKFPTGTLNKRKNDAGKC